MAIALSHLRGWRGGLRLRVLCVWPSGARVDGVVCRDPGWFASIPPISEVEGEATNVNRIRDPYPAALYSEFKLKSESESGSRSCCMRMRILSPYVFCSDLRAVEADVVSAVVIVAKGPTPQAVYTQQCARRPPDVTKSPKSSSSSSHAISDRCGH